MESLRVVILALGESFSVPGASTVRRLATWSQGTPELPLILSLVVEAFLQLLASGLGKLAFVWATVVLLGGNSDKLVTTDFWFTTAIVFVQIARIVGYNSAPEAKFFVDVPAAAFHQLNRAVTSATNIVDLLAVGLIWIWIALAPFYLAAACMFLSINRLASIVGGKHDYRSSSGNVKPALILFYGLVLAQAALFLLCLVVVVNRIAYVETLTKKYSYWQLLLQQQQRRLKEQRLQQQLKQQPQWLQQQLQQLQQQQQQQLQQVQQQPRPHTQPQWLEEERLKQQLQQQQQQLQQLQQQPQPHTQQQWLKEQYLQEQLQQLLLKHLVQQPQRQNLPRKLIDRYINSIAQQNLPRKLIDRYVSSIAETCIQKGVASTFNSTLVSFAAELLLQSDDQDDHFSAVVVLHSLVVTDTERSGRAAEQIYSSDKLVDKLLWMLRSNNPVTKVCVAEIVVELASNCELCLVDIPGGARCISSLLDPHFMKKEEEIEIFVRGLEILGKLASDPENCREIYNTMDLVPKMIVPLNHGLYKFVKDKDDAMSVKIVRESLRVVAKLTSWTGESSRNLCSELTEKYGRAVENILWILSISDDQDMRILAVEILSRLTLDEPRKFQFTAQLRLLLFDTEDSQLRIEAGNALIAREDVFADIKQQNTILYADEFSKEYRTVAAEMLAQICARSTPTADLERSYLLSTLATSLPTVLEVILTETTTDITNLDDSNKKFLASFLGLAVQIREKLATAQDFATAVPGISTADNSFAEKLKSIIIVEVRNDNRDEVSLAIIKAATKLVTWMMEIDIIVSPGYYIEYFQRYNIVMELDAAVKAMAHLERYKVMTGGADENEEYVTLQTLVETAKKKFVPEQQQPSPQQPPSPQQHQPPPPPPVEEEEEDPLQLRSQRRPQPTSPQPQQLPPQAPQQQPSPSSQHAATIATAGGGGGATAVTTIAARAASGAGAAVAIAAITEAAAAPAGAGGADAIAAIPEAAAAPAGAGAVDAIAAVQKQQLAPQEQELQLPSIAAVTEAAAAPAGAGAVAAIAAVTEAAVAPAGAGGDAIAAVTEAAVGPAGAGAVDAIAAVQKQKSPPHEQELQLPSIAAVTEAAAAPAAITQAATAPAEAGAADAIAAVIEAAAALAGAGAADAIAAVKKQSPPQEQELQLPSIAAVTEAAATLAGAGGANAMATITEAAVAPAGAGAVAAAAIAAVSEAAATPAGAAGLTCKPYGSAEM